MTDSSKVLPVGLAAGHFGEDDIQSQDVLQLRERIVDLLNQADSQAEQVRHRMAELLTQVDELREVAKSKDALEQLVLKLQDANHNLIVATFGAQDQKADAEAISHRQEEFLAMLAHELRNPLAPISMATDMIGFITSAHPQLPKLHAVIARQVRHLAHLLDDLVDASRINSGKIILKRKPLLLSEVIDSAVETAQPFITRRNQTLSVTLPDMAISIDGDLVRLAQVFSNLLINATKFTQEHGQISITARAEGSNVLISVKDNGMGIAEEVQPFIFDLFRQGPHPLDRSQGGLGIGLALVKRIAELHDGTVIVHSDGHGSEFVVTLPVCPQAAISVPEAESVRSAGFQSRRILVIEDNTDVNETLSAFLTTQGHATMSTFDGNTGIAMAKANTYDIVFCDIGLPGMSGYEVVKQLRRDATAPLPSYIALTGYNESEDKDLARLAGFNHYLVKPVATDVLNKLISSCPASGA